MKRQLGLIVVASIGCRPSANPTPVAPIDLGTNHPVPRAVATTQPVPDRRREQYQMRQQLEDLHDLEDLLVKGRLDEATPLVAMLEAPHGAGVQQAADRRGVVGERGTAHAMAHATTIEQASQIA